MIASCLATLVALLHLSEAQASIDSLPDSVVSKIFDRSLKASRLPDADLNSALLAKPSHRTTPSLRARGPTFAQPSSAFVPSNVQSYLGQRVPLMKANVLQRKINPAASGEITNLPFSKRKMVLGVGLPSEQGSLSNVNSASEFDALSRKSVLKPWKKEIENLRRQLFASAIAIAIALSPNDALADPAFTKVDKTGFIGGIANVVENSIDLFHDFLQSAGFTSNTYGISIIILTIIIRTLTLPLTYSQVSSSMRISKLQPFIKRLKDVQAESEVPQLYRAANVNPLASLAPAFVQLPVFLSLYRALTNLVAEDKLQESFLWLPSLNGPIYGSTKSDWFSSIFTGNPSLGWDDTKAFLTLPLILIVSQTISSKLISPPKKPKTEKEKQSNAVAQRITAFLPLIVASFSLSVPAGLSIYWITSNIISTITSVAVKATTQTESLPAEVEKFVKSREGFSYSSSPQSQVDSGPLNFFTPSKVPVPTRYSEGALSDRRERFDKNKAKKPVVDAEFVPTEEKTEERSRSEKRERFEKIKQKPAVDSSALQTETFPQAMDTGASEKTEKNVDAEVETTKEEKSQSQKRERFEKMKQKPAVDSSALEEKEILHQATDTGASEKHERNVDAGVETTKEEKPLSPKRERFEKNKQKQDVDSSALAAKALGQASEGGTEDMDAEVVPLQEEKTKSQKGERFQKNKAKR